MGLINLPKKIYSTSWSAKPDASTMTDKIIRISDIGNSANLFISNGTRWQPLGGSTLVAQSNIASSVTGTAVETTLATITVPGGLMSNNGVLEVYSLWSHTNSATSRNIRGRFGAGLGSFLSATITTSNTTQSKFFIRNVNSQTNQYCQRQSIIATYSSSSLNGNSFTQDTSIDFPIVFSGTLTDTSQFITLEGYTIFYTEG